MKKVIVGISGGVDSSVAALLLKKQGYEVIGVTFVFTDDFDETDAILVCKKLGIAHHVLDYKNEFKNKVIEPFLNDYKRGVTPNPCVLCNRYVKFQFLYAAMKKYKADYIATGHYAKVIHNQLYKSSDLNKDQTYFLCELTEEELSKVLFPLEGISKEEVRKIAKENDLITASKKDSTDVCFITSHFKDYIQKRIKSNKGDIIDVSTNKKIGEHNGLSRFTIGQRRGLGIGGTKEKMFVVGKNTEKNILYVALGENNAYLFSDSCILDHVNFNCDYRPTQCTAKFRYRQQEYPVELEYLENGEVLVKYDAIKGVTPGQACVFYQEEACIGGGIIKEVRKENKKLWYLL